MLGLKLRPEFHQDRLKGTAINFNKSIKTNVNEFLSITYPSNDLLRMLEGVGPNQSRPVVVIGERGQGKSHLLTILYNAFKNKPEVDKWLKDWSIKLNRPEIKQIQLRNNMHVIAESLQMQKYKFLWDVLLDNHPNGDYIRGKWDDRGTLVLSQDLVLELLQKQPTAIILDEFQTWYDSLMETKSKPYRSWAFNFIQILSEIAKDYPELLTLVISVRNGESDAYQQIHRVNPYLVNFKGGYAKRDRKRLLLHRLFENRINIPQNDISNLIDKHLSEYIRLMNVPETEQANIEKEYIETWPFSPGLLSLLDDQILVSTEAQETRDLIKILANIFKNCINEDIAVITPAHLSIKEDKTGVAALLDSISNEALRTLREKALRNLQSVYAATKNSEQRIPHVEQLISSLWLRSIGIDNKVGASKEILHIDITQKNKIDSNSFEVEINQIVSNSFNIHQSGDRYVFRQEENPKAKLLSFAQNDRAFEDGSDIERLMKEIRMVIGGREEISNQYKIIVLGKKWESNPWEEVSEKDWPSNWNDLIPIIVIPERPKDVNEVLGKWLKSHIQVKRNKIRFILPQANTNNIFYNRDLLIKTRAIVKAEEWKKENPEYLALQKVYRQELIEQLKPLFTNFAVLSIWNFSNPNKCLFDISRIPSHGTDTLLKIEEMIQQELFVQEDFEELVQIFANNSEPVSKLLLELQEPMSNEAESIPWIGETAIKEKLIRLCSQGSIALNLRESEFLVARHNETEQEAWNRMKGKLGGGSHLEQTYILNRNKVPTTSSRIEEVVESKNIDKGTEIEKYTGEQQDTRNYNYNSGSLEESSRSSNNDFLPNDIFSSTTSSNYTHLESEYNAPLNLLAKTESWGIYPGSDLKGVSIQVENMNGSQLRRLLQQLPDGFKYKMSLDKGE